MNEITLVELGEAYMDQILTFEEYSSMLAFWLKSLRNAALKEGL